MIRVLVIDDDYDIRQVLCQILETEGYEVITATNGNEGIRLHIEQPADLIITDIVMPEKDGIETILEFRHKFPGVKIIAISGGGRIEPGEYLRFAKKLGANHVIKKPFKRKKLLRIVKELL